MYIYIWPSCIYIHTHTHRTFAYEHRTTTNTQPNTLQKDNLYVSRNQPVRLTAPSCPRHHVFLVHAYLRQAAGAPVHDSVSISGCRRPSTWCNVFDINNKECVLLGRCVLVSTGLSPFTEHSFPIPRGIGKECQVKRRISTVHTHITPWVNTLSYYR